MSRTTQQKFFSTLETMVPKGYELVDDRAFSNTGTFRVVPEGTFRSVLVVEYQFNQEYASFDGIHPEIGDRSGNFPYVRFDELETRVLAAIQKHLDTLEVH